jgi:CheY-like chemotaxis protein
MSQTPTVYFIDDSATMREVIKIAFRRENINVVACHNAMSALSQMEQVTPDVVISDLIMPEKDGYEVCQFIKQHPRLSRTPVVLMSGVVNRAVAEKAFAVKADKLIRKPFQPQDLINRVRHLLNPRAAVKQAPVAAATAASPGC